jgi:hypothetical protein
MVVKLSEQMFQIELKHEIWNAYLTVAKRYSLWLTLSYNNGLDYGYGMWQSMQEIKCFVVNQYFIKFSS